MNPTQLELTRLIGKKELTFGCLIQSVRLSRIISKDYDTEGLKTGRYRMIDDGENSYTGIIKEKEIIGHPATLSDFHRWMNEKGINFIQSPYRITLMDLDYNIEYNSSKELLEQSTETLQQIIDLITNNS